MPRSVPYLGMVFTIGRRGDEGDVVDLLLACHARIRRFLGCLEQNANRVETAQPNESLGDGEVDAFRRHNPPKRARVRQALQQGVRRSALRRAVEQVE